MLTVSFDGQTFGFSSHTFLWKLDLHHIPAYCSWTSIKSPERTLPAVRQIDGLVCLSGNRSLASVITGSAPPWRVLGKKDPSRIFFLNPCQYTTDSSKFFINQLITITESLGNVFVRHWHFQFKRLPHPFVQTSLTITIEDYTLNRTILIDQIMTIWK